MSYDHISINEVKIAKIRSLMDISFTGNEDDIVLVSCIPGEHFCIGLPRGVNDEYFHLYAGVLEDFKVCLTVTNFESDLLKTLNISPT